MAFEDIKKCNRISKMVEMEEHLKIDRNKVLEAVKLRMPIEVTSYTLSRNMELYFRNLVEMFLVACHQEHLQEYINYCLGELLANSKKANTKRVYFKEKNLDINNPQDYVIGMENFREETCSNLDHYLELQKKAGLYIKLSLQLTNHNVVIEIKNNSVLNVFEKERIQQKLESVQQYKNIDEVVSNVIDQSEGAGLGIIIINLMLRKIGLKEDSFKIFSTDTETITQIILPCDERIFAGVEIVSYEFVTMQSKIPVFESNFEKASNIVQSDSIMQDEKKVNRQELLDFIRNDTTLSLLILKYALEKDSSCFSLPKAIELLTDQELKFIFSDSNPSVDKIQPTEKLEKCFNNAKRAAFYAYNLHKNFQNIQPERDSEYFYLLGLLNNIGLIFLNTASDEQKEYVKELCNQYDNIGDEILEFFEIGNAGNFISLVYAKSLKMPEYIYNVFSKWNYVEFFDKNRPDFEILYLAQMLGFYEDKIAEYYQIDQTVLKDFQITSESQLKYILKQLTAA